MNKDIRQLIYYMLNEDLLSDLKDEDDDDSDFVNYDENVINSFNDKPNADFMNSYNKVGDLLTYKNNLFFIIKNNKSLDEVRENLNTTYYGKVIGMCVGKGLWLSTEYNYYKTYGWANAQSELYNDNIETTDDGWYNTTYIWDNYSKSCKGTVWNALYKQEITGLGKHICYLPSIEQLQEIQKNNNIIQIDTYKYNSYWSSSQQPNYYDDALLCHLSGYACGDAKIADYHSLALLHFEN